MIDRAKDTYRNILFRWSAPLTELKLQNNHIVNLGTWSSSNAQMGDIEISDHSAHNKMCRDRAACGLKQDQLPDPQRLHTYSK